MLTVRQIASLAAAAVIGNVLGFLGVDAVIRLSEFHYRLAHPLLPF